MPGLEPLKLASGLDRISQIVQELFKSDKKIIEKTNGNHKELIEKEIEKRSVIVKENNSAVVVKEFESTVATYTIMFEDFRQVFIDRRIK